MKPKNYSLLTLLQLSIYEVQCAGQIRYFHNIENVTYFLNVLGSTYCK